MIFSRHIFVYSYRLWPLLVHHDQELPITFGLQVDFCAISCNSSDKALSNIIAVGNHKGTTLEQFDQELSNATSWFLCCMCVDTSGRWMSPHGSTQLLQLAGIGSNESKGIQLPLFLSKYPTPTLIIQDKLRAH